MANINGRGSWLTNLGLDDGYADTLHGTSARDIINGFGGADRLHGHGGNDTINAGMGNDYVHGGPGNDTINGGQGDDTLIGGSGTDHISGGEGNDWIRGGTGYDYLVGGAGRDTFSFSPGDSTQDWASVDVIQDFNSADDTIYFATNAPAGNSSNYHEEHLGADSGRGSLIQDYREAFYEAIQDIGDGTRYAFYTNGHDGFLFADLDNNGAVDTGIILYGADSLRDFSASDIH